MNTKLVDYPPLKTERIQFRILTHDDAEDVFRHFSDGEITRFMDIDPCKDIKEVEEIIQYHLDDSGCRWGMYDINSNQFMGTIGFHYIRRDENLTAEVGFDLCKDFWGKGFMTEAMKEVISFGFSQMGLDVIDATVEPENDRSLRLMRRLGFNEEKELRDNLVYFYLKKGDSKVND